MEEADWKKDKTPYIIFECAKCKQYLYVKTTQKGKKCLRCGRHHRVSTMGDKGEIVYGMTTAVEKVKERQNEFAERELGHRPEFRAFIDFKVARISSKSGGGVKQEGDLLERFHRMLKEISKSYKKFPRYIFEVMVDDYGIPLSELKSLIQLFQKRGILYQLDGSVFKINLNKLV